jgi:AraC family transcriptional regulator, melibiose operon regulatory protein
MITMSDTQLDSFDPDRPDFSPYGLTCVHWQPSSMLRPDHHSEIELNFLRSGSLTYLLGGQKCVAVAGRLSMFWAANPHQIIEFSDDADYIVATIPLQCFLGWKLPEHFVQALMRGQFLSEPSDAMKDRDTQLLTQWAADLQDNPAEMERPVLLEMQARLTRFALNLPSQENRHSLTSVPETSLTKIEQMACYIALHYTQKLKVEQIADHVKLNPNYAMNLFRKAFGTTLINYITLHRISHAQRLLTTTDKSITEIALQSGFLSISRFNDAFSRACGHSPREYRNHHIHKA